MRLALRYFFFSLTVLIPTQALPQAPPSTWWTLEVPRWGEAPALILLTGFGPFGNITDNPSGRIVGPLSSVLKEQCGEAGAFEPHHIAVRPGIIETLPLARYRKIVSIGVDAGTSDLRIETLATNYYYDPQTGMGGPIDPSRSQYSTLNGGPLPLGIDSPTEGFSVILGGLGTAGTYVCNDTFYRVCAKTRLGYFIHIPNIEPEDDTRLAKALGHVVCRILKAPPPVYQSKVESSVAVD